MRLPVCILVVTNYEGPEHKLSFSLQIALQAKKTSPKGSREGGKRKERKEREETPTTYLPLKAA